MSTHIDYHQVGKVERWNSSRRSYEWRTAYTTKSKGGNLRYPWMTRSECVAEAKGQGKKARFHK